MPATALRSDQPGTSVSVSRTLHTQLPPVELANFAGPLDLLLHLVRQGQMDIFDLPITGLCEQYLAHLSAMEALDLNIAGEFFVMAATLIEIKSRMLLPPVVKETTATEGEEGRESTQDPRTELVERLLEYSRFQNIAETLKQAEAERRALFFRPPTEYSGAYAFAPKFGTLSAADLLRTLERMLQSVGAGEQAVTAVRRQKVTLRIKMREVQSLSEKAGAKGIPLDDLIPDPPFLREIVLLFLALLELLKLGIVQVAQEQFCGEIRVFFIPEGQRVREGATA